MTNEELLVAAIENFGSLEKVGKEIGVSKTTLCRIQHGNYPNPEYTYQKLRKKLGYLMDATVRCPGLKFEIHTEVCRRFAEAVRDDKVLSGVNFQLAREMCPYCPINPAKNKEKTSGKDKSMDSK